MAAGTSNYWEGEGEASGWVPQEVEGLGVDTSWERQQRKDPGFRSGLAEWRNCLVEALGTEETE